MFRHLLLLVLLSSLIVSCLLGCGGSPVPPTATAVPPTATPVPPTATPIPSTVTAVPPTATPVPPTATPIPPAPVALHIDGKWSGSTAEGLKIVFTIEDGGLSSYGFQVPRTVCSSNWLFGVYPKPQPISENKFLLDSKDSQLDKLFAGTFASDTESSGTLQLKYKGYGDCTGELNTTWTAAKSDVASATSTQAPVTPTPTPVKMVASPTPNTSTATPAVAPVTPAPAPSDSERPSAIVKVDSLNVRSGPGTNYPVLTAVPRGSALAVLGQVAGCRWLQVGLPSGAGWVIAEANYVELTVECASLPPAPLPPPPVAAVAAPAPAPTGPKTVPADELMKADVPTIARALVDQSRQFLPLALEVDTLLRQSEPACPRLASLIGTFRTAPRYRELSSRLWSTRRNPGLEQDFYQFLDAYSAGFDAFRQQVFEDIRSGCAAGRAPSIAQRQDALKWMSINSTVSKFEHIVNELGPRIGG